MDRIQATPRVRPVIGGLADMLAASYSPERTQQMQGLMQFLQVPDIAQTLDRISYGEPITTGRGMTTALRPEAKSTLGALLGLVPMGRAAEPVAMTAGRAGERVAERVVPQVMERGGLPAEMLGAMAQGTQSPATVFHGSPHLFQRFDASRMGTGEGAQAYGQGLYTASARDVAKSYAPRDPAFEQKLQSAYEKAERSGDYASLQVLEDFMTHRTPSEVQETLSQFAGKDLTNAQRTFNMASKAFQNQKGSYLYQVDLPDEQIAQMLDFDKPLSEQPESVRQAVRGIVESEELYKGRFAPRFLDPRTTGGDALGVLNEALGGPDVASTYLRQAGIPGIRYLDPGSRGAGQGTSNFVVFPGMEDMLRIEQINEQPIQSLFQNLGR
jgi:hypothetical protein